MKFFVLGAVIAGLAIGLASGAASAAVSGTAVGVNPAASAQTVSGNKTLIVGADVQHADICLRCVDNLPQGRGETRHFA